MIVIDRILLLSDHSDGDMAEAATAGNPGGPLCCLISQFPSS
jgi:hypothetical protein